MPRLAQQILIQANKHSDCRGKMDQNTSIHRCTKGLRLHFFLVCDYYGCKNPTWHPVAPRWWLLRTGYSSIRATKFFFFFKKQIIVGSWEERGSPTWARGGVSGLEPRAHVSVCPAAEWVLCV